MHPIALLILVVVTAISAFIAAGRQIRCNNLNAQLNEKDTQIKDALTRLEREMGVSKKLASERDKLTEKLHYAEKALSISYDSRDELTKVATELQDRLQAAEKFEALHKRMTTRNRDPKTGRIVKWDWVSDESAASASKQLKEQFEAKAKPSHRLTRGLTVKNPTESEAKAIFAEAKRLGINEWNEDRTDLDWLWYCDAGNAGFGISRRTRLTHGKTKLKFVTASEFIARMHPLKRVTDLGEREVIHCPTLKEAEAICRLMDEAGVKSATHYGYAETKSWSLHEDSTCYDPNVGGYASIGFYNSYDYTIHKAADFLQPQSNEG